MNKENEVGGTATTQKKQGGGETSRRLVLLQPNKFTKIDLDKRP